MSEETQQPDSEAPDVVRSPKNTDRDLEAERRFNTVDAPEAKRKLVVIDEADDSPKNDRPIDLATLAPSVDAPEAVRKPVVIDHQADIDEGDRSPKNDRDLKA